MIAVKGRYNGSVVVLDEPAPVKGEVAVIVEFPDQPNSEGPEVPARRFSWEESRARQDGYTGNLSDEVIRQRRESRF